MLIKIKLNKITFSIKFIPLTSYGFIFDDAGFRIIFFPFIYLNFSTNFINIFEKYFFIK